MCPDEATMAHPDRMGHLDVHKGCGLKPLPESLTDNNEKASCNR